MAPTSDELRRYFADKLERATFQVEQAARENDSRPFDRTGWLSESFWRGVQVAWKEALAALDGIPEDD